MSKNEILFFFKLNILIRTKFEYKILQGPRRNTKEINREKIVGQEEKGCECSKGWFKTGD